MVKLTKTQKRFEQSLIMWVIFFFVALGAKATTIEAVILSILMAVLWYIFITK